MVVKKWPLGFYFGLMTPERQSNGGRAKTA
jgi:hypothetical protein